jgi:hypothetical protein
MRKVFGGSSWLAFAVALLVILLGAMLLSGCGGGGAASTTTTTVAATVTTGVAPAAGGAGVAVAKEILGAFDELVAHVADLAGGKPDAATLKPQLEQLYASYEPTMRALNAKYLALRDSDVAQFGKCNTYLGNNRGQHVTQKDNVLTEALKYYNLEVGDQAMVTLLSQKPVDLLDLAVKQN